MEQESIRVVLIVIGLVVFMFAMALLGKHVIDKAMSEQGNHRNYGRNAD